MDPMDSDKRALMGFQGMRGKKDSEKRAPMGFQGMRGKRNMAQRFRTGTNFETRSSIDYQGKLCSHIQFAIISRKRGTPGRHGN